MKYKFTASLILANILAYADIGDLGAHIVLNNSLQSANRAKDLLKSDKADNPESFLDTLETQSIGGVGAKASDNTYNASGGFANINRYFGNSSLLGLSLGGIYTKLDGDTLQSEDVALSANLYGATKSNSLPIGAFVDLGYARFLGDSTAFSSSAMSALGGLRVNIDSETKGLSYAPLLMLNSLYLQDSDAEQANYNALKMIAGLELDYDINDNYSASLKGLYSYDFTDATGAYNYNDFTGNYTSLGNAGRESFQFGLGLNYNINDTLSAGFDYSIYFYDNFTSKNLSFKLDLSF